MVDQRNNLRLDDIARRLRAATPAPWRESTEDARYRERSGSVLTFLRCFKTGQLVCKLSASPPDLALISHASEDIEFLLSLLSEYRHEATN